MKLISTALVAVVTIAWALSGCGKSNDEVITMSEMAVATVSGNVNSGSVGTLSLNLRDGILLDWWFPINTAYAAHSCPRPSTAVDGLDCSVDGTGKTMTLAYNSCNFGNNSAVWNGTEILASSAAVSCGQFPSETPGTTLARTFGPGTTRTVGNSVHVSAIDTTNPSGYETPVSGGSLITYDANGKKLEIKGVHVLSQKIFRGNGNTDRVETEADHTLSTVPDNPLDVRLNNGVRTVNGTVKVQHNVEKYTGTAVFENVVYSSADCCLPQSGTITTTLSGSRSGTETLSFSASDCGSAKLENGKGEMNAILLKRCF
ncbi:MAG: hypothetical protein A2428_08425 [Bdellovibrionales bacterium RIFOXYC1_FULL_54_43]|nr:MAG: hypothetical protein A2428_08425 [Bdellovibrionales bacterium RIFOXYC1_FULL_54_43]OFZ80362.1 MAG: hypothetical protein A2603_13340 [Bdellovibrionales bacterium RIFOXYD1_FULL_55_31]